MAKMFIYDGVVDFCRRYGDGMAFVRLLRFVQGQDVNDYDVAPMIWGDGDVGIAADMLGSDDGQAKAEALQMLVRYKISDERLVQPCLALLEEPIEVAFLAARLVREMAVRGLVRLSEWPSISRALLVAGPLVTRELVAAMTAGLR